MKKHNLSEKVSVQNLNFIFNLKFKIIKMQYLILKYMEIVEWILIIYTYLGKPDVHKLSLGCGWQPGLQKPVLRHHPRRG